MKTFEKPLAEVIKLDVDEALMDGIIDASTGVIEGEDDIPE